MKKTLRTNKLIKPRMQLRLMAVFTGIVLLSTLMQFLLMQSRMIEMASTMPSGGEYVLDFLPETLSGVLVTSLCMLLPLILTVGVVFTFRIAGPVYRFEDHLRKIAAGEQVGPCRIRKGDELQGLCEAMNLAFARIQATGGSESPKAEATREGAEQEELRLSA